jgi:hypothetical protein
MAINQPAANTGGNSTSSTLNGLFKEIYADKVMNLVPDNVVLLNMVDFVPQDKVTGNLYHQPVILGHEHGMTYGGSDGTAFTLNDAIAGQVRDATVQGYEFLLRTQISYAVAARSAKSQSAFERGTKLIVANMIRSFAKRLECVLFYGQKELALVKTTQNSATLEITDASWAGGIWIGAENAQIQVYDSTLVTLRGLREIDGVDMELKTLTLDSTINVTAGDRVFWKGAMGNEFKGLQAIIQEASSLFGINPSAYSLFKGVEYSAGSADLSFGKIQQAIARGVEKGLDEDVVCLVNPRTWAKLLTDQAALRVLDSSYETTKTENGSKAITFYAQNGMVEIRPCTYVKESVAFIVPPKELMRVGSTDVTFRLPGREQQDEFFLELPTAAGFELRAYSDQALFTGSPGKLILISAIVNS